MQYTNMNKVILLSLSLSIVEWCKTLFP